MGLEGVRGHRCVGDRHDEGDQPLPVLCVVDAQYRSLGDLRVGGQDPFDLDGVDVLAAGDDHLVVAAHHEQPARLVEVADVTGAHVVLVELFRGSGGVAVELA